MPILLKVPELQPGMCLAANVINRYSVLLPHGRRLTENDVAALRRKFPDLVVQVVDPLLDDAVEFEDNSHDQEVSLQVRRNIASVTHKVSRIVRAGVALDADHVAGMEKVVDEMMAYMQQNPVTMAVIEQSAGWDDYLQEHSANVFYLSVLVGNTIKNYIKRERERLSAVKSLPSGMNITPLATAALFHDIGMASLEHLYHKTEPLTPEEVAAVRAHPTTGAQMLPEKIEPMVRLVVRCHHESFDGSGYPEGLLGPKTNIFARVLRITDAYSAAISKKVYRQAKSPVKVLHEMLYGNFRTLYDPVVLKVFAGIIQPIPVGAKLKLADGRWAVVVRHDRHNSFNPQIVIAFDQFGDPLTKEQLEPPFFLRDRSDVQVAAFGDDDISFLNEDPEVAVTQAEAAHLLDESCRQLLSLTYP